MTITALKLLSDASAKVTALHPGCYLVHGGFSYWRTSKPAEKEELNANLIFYDPKINSFWVTYSHHGKPLSDVEVCESPGDNVSLTPAISNIDLDQLASILESHRHIGLPNTFYLYTPEGENATEPMWIVESFNGFAVGATSGHYYILERSWKQS